MAFAETFDVEFERVRALVPDWLAIELNYANGKYRGRNPQKTAFRGGLNPGGEAYQDAHKYFGHFLVFFTQSAGEKKGLLKASQQLGKFVGTARALVSAVNQYGGGLSPAEGDAMTMGQFEERWFKEEDFGELAPDFRSSVPAMVEEQLAKVRDATDDLPVMLEHAMELLVAEAKLFGAFTLEHSIMVEPGLSSTDEPRPWDKFTVVH